MDYKISDRAKKTTLGIAIIGLVLLVFGFFQQKDFVYAKKINDHEVEIRYNGSAGDEEQAELQQTIQSKMHGYALDFHSTGDHHDSSAEHHDEESHHKPSDKHDAHAEENAHHGGGHHGPVEERRAL